MKLSRYKREYNYSYAFGATLVLELIKTHPELITRVFLRPNLEKQGDKLFGIMFAVCLLHTRARADWADCANYAVSACA